MIKNPQTLYFSSASLSGKQERLEGCICLFLTSSSTLALPQSEVTKSGVEEESVTLPSISVTRRQNSDFHCGRNGTLRR